MQVNFKVLFCIFAIVVLLTSCRTSDSQDNGVLAPDIEPSVLANNYNNEYNTITETECYLENSTESYIEILTNTPINDWNLKNHIDKISNDYIFFSSYDGVYVYNNGVRKIDCGSFPIVKENDNYAFWESCASEDNNVAGIVVYDIENNKYDFFETDDEIVDFWVEDGYIIYSAHKSKDYYISCIDMSDGSKENVAKSVGNLVDFSYCNESIYFTDIYLENNCFDSYRIYKYDMESKTTTMIANDIKNNTSVKMCIAVNENDIFFTNTKNYANDDLYKFNWNTEKIEFLGEEVSKPEKLENSVVYMSGNSIYEYNSENNIKSNIMTLDTSDKDFYGYTVNEKYIVYLFVKEDNIDVMDVYVCDRLTGETKVFEQNM